MYRCEIIREITQNKILLLSLFLFILLPDIITYVIWCQKYYRTKVIPPNWIGKVQTEYEIEKKKILFIVDRNLINTFKI